MPEKEPFIPPEAVEDVGKAEEGAYAEKPFRKALADYQENLSDEQKKTIEWIASQEGEKATKAYEQRKGEEDPRVTLLREKSLELISIISLNDPNINSHMMTEKGRLQNTDDILKGFGSTKIEAIFTDKNIPLGDKLGQIESFAANLHHGVREALAIKHPDRLANEVVKSGAGERGIKEVFDGYIATGLGSKIGTGMAFRAMEKSASYGKSRIQDVVKDWLPYITKAREYSERLCDDEMKRYGFLWDAKNEQYVSLEEEKK